MTLDDLHFLLAPAGQQWLAQLSQSAITPQTHLQLATQLRQTLTAPQTQALLETALLRQQAVAKFSRAAEMYFTRPALEQATAEAVARHRARRFQAIDAQHIADLGCSIGGDAIALAQTAVVTGVEWDAVRLAMAQENVRVYGRSPHFTPLQADIQHLTPLAVDAAFFDPARRDENGRRFYSVQQYQPPLAVIDGWRQRVAATAVKISPGVDYAELPDEAEVEFVSLDGGVKEAILWYGALHSGVNRRATLLPGGHTLTTAQMPLDVPVAAPQAYLYEPDGAVIRAHLVTALAAQINASKIDDEIAYLTGETAVATPFARCFALEDAFPFQLKRLRHYLRQRRIGQVVVKKRGSPIEPEQLQRQLRLDQSQPHSCVIFLTQVQGEPTVLIGQESAAAPQSPL